MLSIASEPGDEATGWLLRSFGPVETVRLGTDATDARGATAVDMGAWRNRVTPRLSADAARRALDDSDRIGAQLLLPGDAGWPASMAVLGDRAPIALWVLGDPRHLSAEAASGFVGARAASTYGSYAACVLATEATERGHTVISGGSYGVDAAAHRAVLMAGGATVAVLPGGLDRQYPSGHNRLFEHIRKSGALVSELAPDTSPTRWRFQERGRLIGALSSALVVVEAGWRSGALLTARQAADLGRGVGAVPARSPAARVWAVTGYSVMASRPSSKAWMTLRCSCVAPVPVSAAAGGPGRFGALVDDGCARLGPPALKRQATVTASPTTPASPQPVLPVQVSAKSCRWWRRARASAIRTRTRSTTLIGPMRMNLSPFHRNSAKTR